MKTSDVLRKAGDVLRKRGWCQDEFENETGAVCAYGAVREVVPFAWSAFVEEFDLVVEESGTAMPAWNDDKDRTIDDVLIAMDAAYVLRLQIEGVEPGDVL